MGKLSVTIFATLDGVVQAPGGPDEDREGGFEHGGWFVPYFDGDFGEFVDGIFARPNAFLFGRTTYDIFAGSWGQASDMETPVAKAFNNLPKYVASRTLEKVEWNNSSLIRDVPNDVAALKEEYVEIQVHGSAGLIPALTDHGLVDIYHVATAPVFLGTGKRLFPDGSVPGALRLVESKVSSTGVTLATYEAAGKPTYGTAEVD